MTRRLRQSVVWVIGFLMWPSAASGLLGVDPGAAATRAAARTTAEAMTQSALIYGGAIILAGVAIGVGLYLGLRRKR
ncbi:MAG: hypothetical protein Q8M66_01515 [Actinomycetota bacterium]|nr:hypothetical protein [Actinomycetota bacterium]MDZ4178400.1 hypothetical protein [Coriobacteriia bacterium]